MIVMSALPPKAEVTYPAIVKLTPAQTAEAERVAREWMAKHQQ